MHLNYYLDSMITHNAIFKLFSPWRRCTDMKKDNFLLPSSFMHWHASLGNFSPFALERLYYKPIMILISLLPVYRVQVYNIYWLRYPLAFPFNSLRHRWFTFTAVFKILLSIDWCRRENLFPDRLRVRPKQNSGEGVAWGLISLDLNSELRFTLQLVVHVK